MAIKYKKRPIAAGLIRMGLFVITVGLGLAYIYIKKAVEDLKE